MHPSLHALAAYRQFIVYRSVPKAGGKYDKLPSDYRTGLTANAHDPAIWTDAATAEATVAAWGQGWGVGFVFTEQDPFWFLDIDSCLVAGQWSQLAQTLCGLLQGCAMEVSQSGTGLHIFGTGQVPAHGCRNQQHGLEFYHAGRFVALTGNNAIGDARTDASAVLPALVAAYFQPDASTDGSQVWTDGPSEEWNGPTEDADLLRRAMQSRSSAAAFGPRASFADLWIANESVLTTAYPDANGRPYDASAADAALAQHLAFWTGKDCERIQRMMRQSALVRDKWEREDYLPRTITAAVSRQVEVLQDKRLELPPAVEGQANPESWGPLARTGDGYLEPREQQVHFGGCVYISGQNRALVPGGVLMKPDAFRVRYGGFTFKLDGANTKTTRDAWEAWTQSQLFACPQVDGVCFKPALPERATVTVDGQQYINTYIPVEIPRKQGDASPFLMHLAKVLPDQRDRTILISYMAACVQHQGVKFQWAPLLQGVEGNGKTLFARCVEQAVGERYTHWPKAAKLSKEFNAWMLGKVFYAVEDIYVPDSKREILEDLKPMITGTRLEIELKGVDQFAGEICGNFMFNSNHRDAIRKTDNDRRFCLLFSAQQQASDLKRDGMTGDYFPDLYKWLREGGYAIVNDLLYTYQIPAEFNPATDCHRAPVTSTTHEAIAASLGNIEQEIQEAIEQGLPGFCGGWVSSIWLERLLERLGLKQRISHHKRKQILEQMGYIYHPALPEGRVNNTVTPDNGKPRLYILANSLVAQIPDAAGAVKNYEAANSGAKSPAHFAFGVRA